MAVVVNPGLDRSGVSDTPRHWSVLHGARLGAAFTFQLHTENTRCNGNVEPFLFFRQRLHQPVDICTRVGQNVGVGRNSSSEQHNWPEKPDLPHVISRMGKADPVDVSLFCLVAMDFYRHQIDEELDRRSFQSVFEMVASPGSPYYQLLCCLQSIHQDTWCSINQVCIRMFPSRRRLQQRG
ncbi:hypothetical protein QTP86_001130 [Hemibagrus guttatus]|nr:hypothetical protein QTP86_001130 [Hemibagrus guttatus]